MRQSADWCSFMRMLILRQTGAGHKYYHLGDMVVFDWQPVGIVRHLDPGSQLERCAQIVSQSASHRALSELVRRPLQVPNRCAGPGPGVLLYNLKTGTIHTDYRSLIG
jgi:hypothetical protein